MAPQADEGGEHPFTRDGETLAFDHAGFEARIRDGDLLRLDAEKGELECLVDPAEWEAREPAQRKSMESESGTGRELFTHMRQAVANAESGAGVF